MISFGNDDHTSAGYHAGVNLGLLDGLLQNIAVGALKRNYYVLGVRSPCFQYSLESPVEEMGNKKKNTNT